VVPDLISPRCTPPLIPEGNRCVVPDFVVPDDLLPTAPQPIPTLPNCTLPFIPRGGGCVLPDFLNPLPVPPGGITPPGGLLPTDIGR